MQENRELLPSFPSPPSPSGIISKIFSFMCATPFTFIMTEYAKARRGTHEDFDISEEDMRDLEKMAERLDSLEREIKTCNEKIVEYGNAARNAKTESDRQAAKERAKHYLGMKKSKEQMAIQLVKTLGNAKISLDAVSQTRTSLFALSIMKRAKQKVDRERKKYGGNDGIEEIMDDTQEMMDEFKLDQVALSRPLQFGADQVSDDELEEEIRQITEEKKEDKSSNVLSILDYNDDEYILEKPSYLEPIPYPASSSSTTTKQRIPTNQQPSQSAVELLQ